MKAHQHDYAAKRFKVEYVDREGMQHCSYCGSLEPGELARLLRTGKKVSLEPTDRKYGWPHKFYVHGVKKEDGSDDWLKFYCIHLLDASKEDKDTIEKKMGMVFTFEDTDKGAVSWRPYIVS